MYPIDSRYLGYYLPSILFIFQQEFFFLSLPYKLGDSKQFNNLSIIKIKTSCSCELVFIFWHKVCFEFQIVWAFDSERQADPLEITNYCSFLKKQIQLLWINKSFDVQVNNNYNEQYKFVSNKKINQICQKMDNFKS